MGYVRLVVPAVRLRLPGRPRGVRGGNFTDPSGGPAGTFRRSNVDAKLGEHLVTFYWRGVASYAIVDEFFDHADDELAGHAMEFVGRSLRETDGAVPERIAKRIQQLWDRRLEVIARDPERHRLEAAAFGISFASAKLAEDWALDALERVVDLVGAPQLGHLVVKHLVNVAAAHPAAATRVLAAMLRNPHNEWDYLGWTDEAKAIVAAADTHTNPDVADDRAAIIDFYVRRGQLDFRELVAGREEPRPRPWDIDDGHRSCARLSAAIGGAAVTAGNSTDGQLRTLFREVRGGRTGARAPRATCRLPALRLGDRVARLG